MSLRYYPSFRIKPNLNATGKEFLLNGKPYVGKYYETYDGKFFSGPNPILGPNESLSPNVGYPNAPGLKLTGLSDSAKIAFASKTKAETNDVDTTEPTGYQPKPLESDYTKGYFYRYFVKKINERGYVKEISETEYKSIQDGSATYDVSYYQTERIMWKLTGPLNTVRLSQYDIRAGITDANKRIVETVDQRFLGLKTYIGEEYAKFSRPTQ
jgi:hypothetical protein